MELRLTNDKELRKLIGDSKGKVKKQDAGDIFLERESSEQPKVDLMEIDKMLNPSPPSQPAKKQKKVPIRQF